MIGILISSTSNKSNYTNEDDYMLFKYVMPSFVKTISGKHNFVFYIGYDNGDEYFEKYKYKIIKKFSECYNFEIYITGYDNPKKSNPCYVWNKLYEHAINDDCDYFYQLGDDIVLQTSNWDDSFVTAMKSQNNIGIVGGMSNKAKVILQAFVSKKHWDIFGYLFCPEFKNFYSDVWIDGIYKNIARTHCTDIFIENKKVVYNWNSAKEQNRYVPDMCEHLCNKLIIKGIKQVNEYLGMTYSEDLFSQILLNKNPYFHCRFGGIAWDMFVNYNFGLSINLDLLMLKEGYYDNTNNSIKNLHTYFKLIHNAYSQCDSISCGNAVTMKICGYNHRWCNVNLDNIINSTEQYIIYKQLFTCPISNYEDILYFNYFHKWFPLLEGKRVLIVNPFKKTILTQWDKRDKLFNPNFINGLGEHIFENFKYPNFELIILETPITYYRKDIIYPDNNWLETNSKLCNEVAKLEFDIALLSCSVHALPIGLKIKEMGKIALYIGGVMQLYFGIKGKRYTTNNAENMNEFYQKMMNEHWIFPIEQQEQVYKIEGRENAYPDAYSAYW